MSAPVADGLFTWPEDDPALLGSKCRPCGTVTFPTQASCPKCTSTDTDVHELPREGELWSWTVQSFEPKPPYRAPADGFEPYGVGYVDLAGEVIVESRLTTADPDELQIGMPMRLVIVPSWVEPDGTSRVTFAFAPSDAA